jgi:hypothetical protein
MKFMVNRIKIMSIDEPSKIFSEKLFYFIEMLFVIVLFEFLK